MSGFDNISIDQLDAEHDVVTLADIMNANGLPADQVLIGGSIARGEAQHGDDIDLFFVVPKRTYRQWSKGSHRARADEVRRFFEALGIDEARVNREIGLIGRNVDIFFIPKKDFRVRRAPLVSAPDLAILHADERRSLFVA